MGIALNEHEMWDFLASAHTCVLSSIRRDGSPAATPMWSVVHDDALWLRTLASSPKAANIRRDDRVCVVAESGLAWAELKSVVLYGRAIIEADEETIRAVDEAFASKYRDFLVPKSAPEATRAHYAAPRIHIRIAPVGRALTWDNAKLRR
jgi:PPOX class probable F420-dependent enzyme